MSDTKRIAKNSVFELSVFFARAITLFIVPIIIARMGDSILLGKYATIIALISLFVFISEYGISTYLIREIARLRDQMDQVYEYINTSISLATLLSLIAIIALSVAGVLLGYSSEMIIALLIAGFGLAFESITSVILASFRGMEEMKWSSIVTFIMEVSFLLFTYLALSYNAQIIWIMVGFVLSRIIAILISIYAYQVRFDKLHFSLNKKKWLFLLKKSSQFAIFDVVTKIHGSLGLIVLSGNIFVALYEVTLATTFRLNILARAVTLAIYPFLSAEFGKGGNANNYYSEKLSQFMLSIGVITAIIVWLFSEYFILLLYGDEFTETIIAIKLLSLIIPIRFICNSFVLTLSTTDRQHQCSYASIVAAVFSVTFNVLLIPYYNLMGAVYAALITQVVFFFMLIWHLRKDIKELLNIKMFITPTIAGILSVALYLFGSKLIHWWVLLILILIVYSLIIIGINKPIRTVIKNILIRN